MADNVPITAGSGTSVATDDVAGVHYQRTKVVWGPDGTVNDADVANGKPLPVQIRDADGTARSLVLPAALGANGGLKIEGVASGTTVPVSGTVTATVAAATVKGTVAHDAPDAPDAPVKVGAKAVAHGSNPTAVAAADVTDLYANRHGVQFVIGGHPNVVTVKHTTITTAVTDAVIISASAGIKIVVTAITAVLDNASTVFPTLLVGFGAANTPTTTGVILAHGGVPAGGGVSRGDGSGIIGIGGDGEDLRVTTTGNATGNGLQIVVTYFTIES